MTKTSELTKDIKEAHKAVLDLSDIWVHCIDRCVPGREQEIDDVFEELGRLRITDKIHNKNNKWGSTQPRPGVVSTPTTSGQKGEWKWYYLVKFKIRNLSNGYVQTQNNVKPPPNT